MEGYEPILRKIRELEERMRRRAETIEYFESILKIKREEYYELTRLAPELIHRELFYIDPAYRATFFSVRSLKGWQTRDAKMIEELKKVIPPYKWLRVVITFSIETGEGHEPFYAEVTCDTVVGAEETAAVDRIVNATIKLFWIMFDVQKALYDLSWLKESEKKEEKEIYDFIVKRKMFFQKYAEEIYEYAMDNLLSVIIKLGGLERSREEYVTCQAIIKIGIEYYPAPEEAEPKYPKVHILIEKGTSVETKGEWTIERVLLIADETEIDIMRILGMRYEE